MVNSTALCPEPLPRMTKGWEPVHSTTLLMRCPQSLLLLAFALCSINGSCIYVHLVCLDNGNRVMGRDLLELKDRVVGSELRHRLKVPQF